MSAFFVGAPSTVVQKMDGVRLALPIARRPAAMLAVPRRGVIPAARGILGPMGWYIAIAVVLLILAVLGSRANLRRRIDRGAGEVSPEIAEAVRRVSQDIDRGRAATRGFL